jgi:hypothetical protein
VRPESCCPRWNRRLRRRSICDLVGRLGFWASPNLQGIGRCRGWPASVGRRSVVYCPREGGSILALVWAETPRLSEFTAVPARFERATCGSEGLEPPRTAARFLMWTEPVRNGQDGTEAKKREHWPVDRTDRTGPKDHAQTGNVRQLPLRPVQVFLQGRCDREGGGSCCCECRGKCGSKGDHPFSLKGTHPQTGSPNASPLASASRRPPFRGG